MRASQSSARIEYVADACGSPRAAYQPAAAAQHPLLRPPVAELPPQVLPQQAVVGERACGCGDGVDEDAAPRQQPEHERTAAAAGDGVARRPGEGVQRRRSHEEAPHPSRQPSEHLLLQDSRDAGVLCRHGVDDVVGVPLSTEVARRQLRRERPPLGTGIERVELRGGQRSVCDVAEEQPRLLPREGEVRCAEVHHVVSSDQAARLWRLSRTGDDDDEEPGMAPLGEGAEVAHHVGIGGRVERVEHEHGWAERAQLEDGARDDMVVERGEALVETTERRRVQSALGSRQPRR